MKTTRRCGIVRECRRKKKTFWYVCFPRKQLFSEEDEGGCILAKRTDIKFNTFCVFRGSRERSVKYWPGLHTGVPYVLKMLFSFGAGGGTSEFHRRFSHKYNLKIAAGAAARGASRIRPPPPSAAPPTPLENPLGCAGYSRLSGVGCSNYTLEFIRKIKPWNRPDPLRLCHYWTATPTIQFIRHGYENRRKLALTGFRKMENDDGGTRADLGCHGFK